MILTPPPLFESIKMARTEKGVTWHVIETAKLVAGDNGLVAVAAGKDETYTVLDRGSKLQGALSALFGKMWDYPPLSDIVQNHNRFMLIATSIKAVYDHTARKMELQARLVVAQDGKHVHVKHNCGDSPTYLSQHPELAQTATKRTQHRSLPPNRAPQPEPSAAPTPSQASSSTRRPTEPPYPPAHTRETWRWSDWGSWSSYGNRQSWDTEWEGGWSRHH